MKWFALLGLLLFLGVAVAPSINADVKEQVPITVEDRQYQRLMELTTHIIEYYDTITNDEDCGCSVDNTPWRYPVFCTFLFFFYLFTGMLVAYDLDFAFLWEFSTRLMQFFGPRLNCWWMDMAQFNNT